MAKSIVGKFTKGKLEPSFWAPFWGNLEIQDTNENFPRNIYKINIVYGFRKQMNIERGVHKFLYLSLDLPFCILCVFTVTVFPRSEP